MHCAAKSNRRQNVRVLPLARFWGCRFSKTISTPCDAGKDLLNALDYGGYTIPFREGPHTGATVLKMGAI
jgi:hypothetical protein